MNYEILSKPLNLLLPDELREIRQVADTLFVRLCRPFQLTSQHTAFSFPKTLRTAQRLGEFLPEYEKTERLTPKSRLVIAMSLSGIDRCYAVGIIPLLCQLQKIMRFKLFIYTDDLVPAVFTQDGFLENDIDIAWNNSNWVNMIARLGRIEFNRHEDHLLIIDSLGGGGDSKFYLYWTKELNREVEEVQNAYKGEPWQGIRDLVAEHGFSAIEQGRIVMPAEWREMVRRNTEGRWVNAPCMKQYLIRWLFHPQFGRRRHGDFNELFPKYESTESARDVARDAVRNQFASIHLLTPVFSEQSKNALSGEVMPLNLVDYHHEANTLEGVAKVFANVIFRRETKRLKMPPIRFGQYRDEEEVVTDVIDSGKGGGEHTELVRGSKCFSGLPTYDSMPDTTVSLYTRKRGKLDVSKEDHAINEVGITFSSYTVTGNFGDVTIGNNWSTATKERTLREWFGNAVKHEYFVDGENVRTRYRDNIAYSNEKDEWVGQIDFKNTRAVRDFVREYIDLMAPVYWPFFKKTPLRHVIWCTRAMFNHTHMAFSCRPTQDKVDQREQVWHEASHYAYHACPIINVSSNSMLAHKTHIERGKLADMLHLGNGEYAYPTRHDTKPWIKPYAGKVYKRIHRNLPLQDEILPVYLPYFTTPSLMLRLFEHDKTMFMYIVYVICGGPLADFQAQVNTSRIQALAEVERMKQKSIKTERGYTARRGGGGRRKSSGGGGGTYIAPPTPSVTKKPYSFGV